MAILKKILAVVGILSVLVCAVVVPCSAFSVIQPNPFEDQFYLYTPVKMWFDLNVPINDGTREDWQFNITQNEQETLYQSYTAVKTSVEGKDTAIDIRTANSYNFRSDGGVTGRTSVYFNENGDASVNPTATLYAVSLPVTYALRALKSEQGSPYITSTSGAPVVATYEFDLMKTNSQEVEHYTFTRTYTDNKIFVVPNEFLTTVAHTGWSNYIVLNYTVGLEGVSVSCFDGYVSVVLPSNGACGRRTPYSDEYSESYVEKIANERIEVVDANFNFLDWLGSAFGFFDVPLFGDFTIGGLLAVVVSISLVIAFLKIFAGG